MAKMNFSNDQTAFEYALYMIVSSYFEKCECKTPLTEGKMLLQYKEQKAEKQYAFEGLCIKYMQAMEAKLPHDLFERKVEVRLRKIREDLPTEIIFSKDDLTVSFFGIYAGKKTRFGYRILS